MFHIRYSNTHTSPAGTAMASSAPFYLNTALGTSAFPRRNPSPKASLSNGHFPGGTAGGPGRGYPPRRMQMLSGFCKALPTVPVPGPRPSPCCPQNAEQPGLCFRSKSHVPGVPPPGSSRAGGFAPRRGRWLQQLWARPPGRRTTSSCPMRACLTSTSKWVGAPGAPSLSISLSPLKHDLGVDRGSPVEPGLQRILKGLVGVTVGNAHEDRPRMGRGSTLGTGLGKRARGS